MAGRPKVCGQPLDEESIVDAALEVAPNRMADLTMRAVSDKLQVSIVAPYKHVAGREDLVALVVEKTLGQAPQMAPDAGDGWSALSAQVLGLQALVDRYPGLDEVVIAHSPRLSEGQPVTTRGNRHPHEPRSRRRGHCACTGP